MPLYEYLCDACGRRFEVIRKFSDMPLEECPHCGGTVHKLFSSPAIQFKGSGFYITDYAKKDNVASAKADGAKTDKGETADKSESTEKTSETTEKKSDTPAKTETAAAAAKDTKST